MFSMLFLKSIERLSGDEIHRFLCTIEQQARTGAPVGTMTIEVGAEELLDYGRFQLDVMRRLGVIFRHETCEARTPELANHFWLDEVEYRLRVSDRAAEGDKQN
jgi:hypothetical protein